ncbi:MAG: hypothetical protein AAFY73_13500 [Pseudomonadota bacterium]
MSRRNIAMSDPRGHHTEPAFLIERQDDGESHVLARIDDWSIAQDVYRELLQKWPTSTVVMRQGARVIEKRNVELHKFECMDCGQLVWRNIHDPSALAEIVCPGCGAPATSFQRLGSG